MRFRFGRLEGKRLLRWIPKVWVSVMIFIACAIGLFVGIMGLSDRKVIEPQIVVGYVSEEDKWTQEAIAYIEQLDAWKGWCRFERVETKEGMEALRNGELAALVVIPEGMIRSIITGENISAKMYLGGLFSQYQTLFETLGNMAIKMLQGAQVQVYAAYALTETGIPGEVCDQICKEIDRTNLQFVLERESYFQHHIVSMTGNDSNLVYFGSMLFIFVALIYALFVSDYAKFEKGYGLYYEKRAGIPIPIQAGCRLIGEAILFFLCFFPVLTFTGRGNQFFLFVVLSFGVAAFAQLLQILAGQKKYLWIITIFSCLIQGYVTGCLVPDFLLTTRIKEIARIFPAYWWKQEIRNVLSGQTYVDKSIYSWMIVWILITFLISVICIELQEKKQFFKVIRYKTKIEMQHVVFHKPAIWIQIKRMFAQPLFWICILLPLVVTSYLDRMEKSSSLGITVGILDESGEWKDSFSDDIGMIHFAYYDSLETLQKEVLTGKISCGYELREHLKEDLLQGNATWSIPCYQTEDAILAAATSEVVFSQIFEEISRIRFAQKMQQLGIADADGLLQGEFHTFAMQVEKLQQIVQNENDIDTVHSLILLLARLACVLVCAAYGICFLWEDKKEYRFYKRNHPLEKVLIVLFPVCLGLILQFLLT